MINKDDLFDRLSKVLENYLNNLDMGYIIQEFLDRFDLEKVLYNIFTKTLGKDNMVLKNIMKEQIELILKESLERDKESEEEK